MSAKTIMIYSYFLEGNPTYLIINSLIFSVLCLVVIFACFVDLGFGIYNSKKLGSYTHSAGLRETVRKLVTYLSFMFIAFLVDAINPLFVYWDIAHLPLLSILIALFLLSIEMLSVREHASKGMRKKFRQTPTELKGIIKEAKNIVTELKDLKDEITNNND